MNRIIKLTAATVLGILITAGPTMAQSGSPSQPADRSVNREAPRIEGLREGVTARVSMQGARRQGKLSQVRSDSLWLSSGGERIALPVASLDSAWTLERSAGRGALIGAVSGAVAVGTFGALLVNAYCGSSSGCMDDYPAAVLVGGLIGLGGGGVLGAGAGLLVRQWKRRLPVTGR